MKSARSGDVLVADWEVDLILERLPSTSTSTLNRCYNHFMPRPEHYQMGFDFSRPTESSPLPRQASWATQYPDLAGLGAREEDLGQIASQFTQLNG